VPLPNVPAGGTLAVHLPRGGSEAAHSVADAMKTLAPDLAKAPYVDGLDFYLPGKNKVLRLKR
jgi:hypothetical protein